MRALTHTFLRKIHTVTKFFECSLHMCVSAHEHAYACVQERACEVREREREREKEREERERERKREKEREREGEREGERERERERERARETWRWTEEERRATLLRRRCCELRVSFRFSLV